MSAARAVLAGRMIVTVAALTLALAVVVAAAGSDVRTVHVTLEHSRFLIDGLPERTPLRVRHGEAVRFVVTNADPIDHELIVGDVGTQQRHEDGTDAHHDGEHGAISVAAGATGETVHTFVEDGVSWLGCHLPGHWSYGMRLLVELEDR